MIKWAVSSNFLKTATSCIDRSHQNIVNPINQAS